MSDPTDFVSAGAGVATAPAGISSEGLLPQLVAALETEPHRPA